VTAIRQAHGRGVEIITGAEVALDPSVRALCRRPYPGHPRGCPNWGKRPACPPEAALLSERMDLSRPVGVVWNRFDLGAHVARMRAKHPEWSDRQCRCCLYWQPRARKQLRAALREALRQFGPGRMMATCPEAMGVNVTETMRRVGVVLEWPPVQWAYQVALIGYRRA